jgi:hypothetical protein
MKQLELLLCRARILARKGIRQLPREESYSGASSIKKGDGRYQSSREPNWYRKNYLNKSNKEGNLELENN